ncbi:MAG: DUF488 family protein [Terracidiphilus sp.]
MAPSAEFQNWFGHDPTIWNEFANGISLNLKANPNGWQPIVEAESNGVVPLIYRAIDETHNNAVAPREFLGPVLVQREMCET